MSDDSKTPPSSTFSRIKTDLKSALDQWEKWEQLEQESTTGPGSPAPQEQGARKKELKPTLAKDEQKLLEMQLLLKELHAKMKELKLG